MTILPDKVDPHSEAYRTNREALLTQVDALHEQLASWAKEDKASLNALIVGLLEKAVEQHESKAASKGGV